VDISLDEIYRKLVDEDTPITTSQPNPAILLTPTNG
jgi:hypothetical protein